MTTIKNSRMADENHAVTTVEGGGNNYRRKPCSDCPWRKDAAGEFPTEAFRLSANTGMAGSGIMEVGDAAFHTFGCHQTGSDKPAVCAGYILKGDQAIGWRMAVSRGKFDPAKVSSEVPLFNSYYEMAVTNGVPPDDPALRNCAR